MVRLKHERSGVVVDVDEGLARNLVGYKPVEVKPAPRKRAATKSDKKSD